MDGNNSRWSENESDEIMDGDLNQDSYNYFHLSTVDDYHLSQEHSNVVPVINDNHGQLGTYSYNYKSPVYNGVGDDGLNLMAPTDLVHGYCNNAMSPNQMNYSQNYEFRDTQYLGGVGQRHDIYQPHENSNYDLNQQFQGVSLQENRNMQEFNFQQSPILPCIPENHRMLPSLPSPITSSSETSESSEDSEGSFGLPSHQGKKGRGRPPVYKTIKEKKAARSKAQKKYANKKKSSLNELKIEVPALEKQNLELERRMQALLRTCKEMLLHKDLPEMDQSIIGAIIGFE